jgi:hypothetical protein
VTDAAGVPAAAAEDYAALPDAVRPNMLVPLASRRAAAQALRQFHSGTRARTRLAKEAMALSLRAGAGQRLLGHRVSVVPAADAGEEATLAGHLGRVLGHGDLAMAVTIGHLRRPNRKPVLQLLGADGSVLGYAKVGWNETTVELVRREAEVIASIAERRPRAFSVPALLHHGSWQGLELMVVEPVPPPPWYRPRPQLELPVAATSELGGLFGRSREPLAESAYWADTRRRAEGLAGSPQATAAGDIGAALERLEAAHGTRAIELGAWHGDWGPWNMARADGRLVVWDWERCRQGVPYGLDAAHFAFHVALQLEGRDAAAATRSALARTAAAAPTIGLEAGDAPLLLHLELVEMALRHEEARAAGVKLGERIHLEALRHLEAGG